MINDTILIRIDLERIREQLEGREEAARDDREQIIDRLLAAFQRKMEEQARELEEGKGEFEACFFDAL